MENKELPKYKSHKEVAALKIKDILPGGPEGGVVIVPEEEGFKPFTVDNAYCRKHNPQVGGYYVVYKDGYTSFSPADVFEDGNTLIKETTFLERLETEEKELGEKVTALAKALNSDGFSEKVGYEQFELLSLQHSTMIAYRRVLNIRLNGLRKESK